jgi:hypothetical protein
MMALYGLLTPESNMQMRLVIAALGIFALGVATAKLTAPRNASAQSRVAAVVRFVGVNNVAAGPIRLDGCRPVTMLAATDSRTRNVESGVVVLCGE